MKQTAQEYLLSIPLWTKKKNTLLQVRAFLEEMGNPDTAIPMIHVAGTNGKGSVCAGLTGIFMEAGYRVGTFVSPHLVRIQERFLVNAIPVDDGELEESFCRVYQVWEKLKEQGYCHPTFFEYLFFMAMDLFEKEDLDLVILETGMGGRLDTTNVIEKPLATVITSISLDHTQYLGDTIEKIALEKAGIIKAGVPVIFDQQEPAATQVILKQAKALGAKAYGVSGAYEEAEFSAPYLARNAALAVKTAEIVGWKGITEDTIQRGLKRICWQGRMEPVGSDIWLDGAHNPGGILALNQAVEEMQKQNPKNLQLLFAAVGDKDYNRMIELLCRDLSFTRITVTHMQSERSLSEHQLEQVFASQGYDHVVSCPGTKEALEEALSHKKEGDRLLIAGSLYLIGEIKEHLRRR